MTDPASLDLAELKELAAHLRANRTSAIANGYQPDIDRTVAADAIDALLARVEAAERELKETAAYYEGVLAEIEKERDDAIASRDSAHARGLAEGRAQLLAAVDAEFDVAVWDRARFAGSEGFSPYQRPRTAEEVRAAIKNLRG